VSITTGVRVEGLNRMVADLRAMGVEVADLKDAFATIAREAAGVTERLVPRRTGALAASARGNRAANRATVTVGYAKRVAYAHVINYGWPRHNIEPSDYVARTDAIMKPRVARIIEDGIDGLIRSKGLD
jgi:hypothetical protein